MKHLPLIGFLFFTVSCKGKDMEVYRTAKPVGGAVDTAETMPPSGFPMPGAGSDLAWQPQPGWTAKPSGGIRFASFDVPTAKGKADLSVVVLEGDAGGVLANVNRWRGQLGLPTIDEASLHRQAKPVSSTAGTLLTVDLVSADGKSGILASILPKEGRTWFFKLTGSAAAVKAAKPSVLRFLGTLHR